MARVAHDDVDDNGEHEWHSSTCPLPGPCNDDDGEEEPQAKSLTLCLASLETLLFPSPKP